MFPTMSKFEAKEVKTTKVSSNYSSRFFWKSHLDAIAAFITFVVFMLIISMLSFAGGMDPQVSQQLTNFNPVGQDILVFGAIITVLILLLLLLPLIISASSDKFTEHHQRELLYILGININQVEETVEERVEEPLPLPRTMTSMPRDKLGLDQEGKWTFNGTRKARMLGKDQEEKWTYDRTQNLDETQV